MERFLLTPETPVLRFRPLELLLRLDQDVESQAHQALHPRQRGKPLESGNGPKGAQSALHRGVCRLLRDQV